MIAMLGTAFCSCAGGPSLVRKVEVMKGSRALISVQQASLNLTLVNQSSLTPARAKAARKADVSLKLIPDAQLQLLADMLGAEQFFEMASEVADPEARSWVTVVVNGKKHIVSGRAARGDFKYMQRFQRFITLFNTVYSANDNFTGSKMTTKEFKRASETINSDSNAVRRKKRNSKRP